MADDFQRKVKFSPMAFHFVFNIHIFSGELSAAIKLLFFPEFCRMCAFSQSHAHTACHHVTQVQQDYVHQRLIFAPDPFLLL